MRLLMFFAAFHTTCMWALIASASADGAAHKGNTTHPAPHGPEPWWGNATFLKATQYGEAEGQPSIPYYFARELRVNTLCHTSLWRELNDAHGDDDDHRSSTNLVVEICADYWCRDLQKMPDAICNAYVHRLMTYIHKKQVDHKYNDITPDETGKGGRP